jgi:hypothetical protein
VKAAGSDEVERKVYMKRKTETKFSRSKRGKIREARGELAVAWCRLVYVVVGYWYCSVLSLFNFTIIYMLS